MITWLLPAALWGLAALAVPVLVHLLTKQERRATPFPSLRFLTATRLVSMRHRRLHDWLLLAVRAAIVALAALALAAPLLLTAQRQRAWNARVARAVIVAGGEAGQLSEAVSEELRAAFASRVIPMPGRLADAVRAATEWLAAQPPAARELVIAGDLRDGAVAAADFAAVPEHVGIRFLPDTDAAVTTDVVLPVMTRDGGRVVVDERRLQLLPEESRVAPSAPAGATPAHTLEVRAAAADQSIVDAARAALLDEGIVADAGEPRHVIVVWPGAEGAATPSSPAPAARPALPAWASAVLLDLGLDGGLDGDALLVRVPERPDGPRTVATLRAIARAAFDDPGRPQEPRRVSASDLASWSRPSGASPADAVRQDEGDRRVLWALALVLLGVEAVLRRRRGAAGQSLTSAADGAAEEAARVA